MPAPQPEVDGVVIDATETTRVTIRTSDTGTVQAWGRITGTDVNSDDRTLLAIRLTNATVYDGRLRAALLEIDELREQAAAGGQRRAAIEEVLTILEQIQPVDRAKPVD